MASEPGGVKLSDGAQLERVRSVYEWLVEGCSALDVERRWQARYPDDDGTAEPYVVEAVAMLAKAGARWTREAVVGWCMESSRRIYMNAQGLVFQEGRELPVQPNLETARKCVADVARFAAMLPAAPGDGAVEHGAETAAAKRRGRPAGRKSALVYDAAKLARLSAIGGAK